MDGILSIGIHVKIGVFETVPFLFFEPVINPHDRMLRTFLTILLLGSVFGLGLFGGVLWQARYGERPEQTSPPTDPAPSPKTPETTENEEENLTEEERRIAEALEDPEFKRLHDHLMREQSLKMNIPTLPRQKESTEPQKKEFPSLFDP